MVIGRAFVAVAPPGDVLDAVAARVTAARRVHPGEQLRWVRDGWHATLAFLGRVDAPDRVTAALADAVRDVEAPTVRLGGAGAFPRARHGSVLWIGFAEGADALVALARDVGTALAPLGFELEDRPFRAHVTVARSSRPRDLRAVVAALDHGALGKQWRVDEVSLLASETHPEGARYSVVSRFPLRAPAQ